MYTASFSEARKNLTEIADRVATEGVEYTIFKRSKPLFKIVPVREEPAGEALGEPAAPRPFTRREAAQRAAARADRVRTPKNWADLKAAGMVPASPGAGPASAAEATPAAEAVPAGSLDADPAPAGAAAPDAPDAVRSSSRPRIPDGGQELFEYAMRLRARMPRNTFLSTMTPQDLKRELANRDV